MHALARPTSAFVSAWLLACTAWLGLWAAPAQAVMPAAGTVLGVRAELHYTVPGAAQREVVYSTLATLQVAPIEIATLQGEAWVARPPGVGMTLSYMLSNMGNTTSTFSAAVANANNCTGYTDTTDIANLRLVNDLNGNGLVDPTEPVVTAPFTLAAGQRMALLVTGVAPFTNVGGACVALTLNNTPINTNSGNINQTLTTFVSLEDNPVVQIQKLVGYSRPLEPGNANTVASYVLTATNNGARNATPTQNIVVDRGNPTPVFLLRDVMPKGAQYVPGTLKASHPNALVLYRYVGDAEWAYSSAYTPGIEVIEVAMAIPASTSFALIPGQSVGLSFDVVAKADANRAIDNVGQAFYGTGGATATTVSTYSNHVVVPLSGQRLGLALRVVNTTINHNSSGVLDGTVSYTFALRVRNYGNEPLFNLNLKHVLSGTNQFGTYTSGTPASGQYTIEPGSLKVVGLMDSTVTAPINPSFSGDGTQTNLLATTGSMLPVNGEFTVQYQVRANLIQRANLNTWTTSVLGTGGRSTVTADADTSDVSTNGSNPDPDSDNNPNNNAEPTPITVPNVDRYIRISKNMVVSMTASNPTRTGPGEFDVTYTVKVQNTSTDPNDIIPYVRVINNLSCTFDNAENVQSWSLKKAPTSTTNNLPVSSLFTGRAGCNDPSQPSTNVNTFLTNGGFALAPGQYEQYSYTVHVVQKVVGPATRVKNAVWFNALDDANFSANTIAAKDAGLISLLVDPQGYVYDTVTRLPVAGAKLTFTRLSCDAGPVPDMKPEQIYSNAAIGYTYSGKSVSMVTGADGLYQFFWNVPPIDDVCTYTVTVTPPSGYKASTIIPAQSGTYGGCSAVVAGEGIPTANDDTTWYTQLRTGYKASNTQQPDCMAVHNHIPLDPTNMGSNFSLSKQANKTQAEMGDFVDYQLKLTNSTGADIRDLNVVDILPPGFSYVKGSSRLNNTVALPDPVASADNQTHLTSLRYIIDDAATQGQSQNTIRYRLRIGPGVVVDTDAINTAQASARAKASLMPLQTNTAQARVRVSGGVFSNQAFAIGKVWADCNANGLQDGPEEPGIPGVRLYLENGVSVITDQFGRWSLYGLKPTTHVLRVDNTTLPVNSTVALTDNRQSGQADSRFLDLKNGELARADTAINACQSPLAMQEIEKRQKAFEKAIDNQLQALVSARLAADVRTAPLGDTRGMPASGVAQGGGNAAISGMVQPPINGDAPSPLIAMPKNMAQGVGLLSPTAPMGSGGQLSPAVPAVPAVPPAATPAPSPAASAASAPAAPPAAAPQPAKKASLDGSLLGRIATLSSVPLEEVIEKLPPKASFIELRDGDTVLNNVINVRVTGPQQSLLRLIVNDQPVADSRVGKKSQVVATGLVAYEFIGIALQPGINQLVLHATDEFGNVREKTQIKIRAPSGLSQAALIPEERLSANPLVPAKLRLKLTDDAGVPITARTMVTLESNTSTWLNTDLSPNEPGVQIFVEGGEALVQFQPPPQPSEVLVRVSAGSFKHEQRLTFLPALTPMQGIGIVEGVIDLSKAGRLQLNQPQSSNAFEQVITDTVAESDHTRASQRAAFYFKGTIKGEYLLTTAYDSDKQKNERLFRDIRPDEFYPVYGDGSVRGYDAQSTGRLYVRIDKNRSFLLLGDFNSASSQEVRQLSQYSRVLSGVQHRYQDDNVRLVSFYSQTNATQQVEEFQANGLSFYNLNNVVGNIRPGAEKVEILVRDRRQLQTILSTRTLNRGVDYNFEPLTRRLYLVAPLSAIDLEGNPQSIRVTFELDANGPTYNVMGADAQVKVTDTVQLGAVKVQDENPQNKRDLVAVTGLARVGDNTSVSAEAVQTTTDLKGKGNASRVSMRHEQSDLRAQAQILKTDNNFDNLSAGAGAGRTEAMARAEYALDEVTRAKADALKSIDNTGTTTTTSSSNDRHSVSVALERKLSDQFVGEIGARTGNMANYSLPSAGNYSQFGSNASNPGISSLGNGSGMGISTPTAINDFTTVRSRLTMRPSALPRLQAFGEIEQDVDQRPRRAATLGGSLGLTDTTRLYAQTTTSSLADVSTGNDLSVRKLTTVGIDSAYMEGGRIYNEYRAYPTAAPQNASGIRNTYKINDQWRVNGSLEHIQTVGPAPAPAGGGAAPAATATANATSVTLGLDWVQNPWRASAATEQRRASTNQASLYSLASAWRMNADLTLLGRLIRTATDDLTNNSFNHLDRQQIGMAWRPAYADRWNVLSRYEHYVQNVGLGSAASTDPFAAVAGTANTTVGRTETHVVSTHANWQVRRGENVSMRWAAKTTSLQDTSMLNRYWATLVHGRYTHDINKDWDIGIQAGLLLGQGGTRQNTAGLEVGYQLVPNLWLSGGYNVVGLRDADLTGQNYTSQGLYMRLRWKFDEATLQFGRVAAPTQSEAPSNADSNATVKGGQ